MNVEYALIVDDSKSARFSLRKKLQQLDLKVDMAESATEAIEWLKSQDNLPDLIFMDHFMPEMDGFEATRTIKTNPLWSSVAILMCTSKEGDEYVQEAKENGALGILPKPATQQQIIDMIKVVDQHRSQAAPLSNTETPQASTEALEEIQTISEIKEEDKVTLSDTMLEKIMADIEAKLKNSLSKIGQDIESSTKAAISPMVMPLITNKIDQKFESKSEELQQFIKAQIDTTQQQTNSTPGAQESGVSSQQEVALISHEVGELKGGITALQKAHENLESRTSHLLQAIQQELAELVPLKEELESVKNRLSLNEHSINEQAENSEPNLESIKPMIAELINANIEQSLEPLTDRIASELEEGLYEIIKEVEADVKNQMQSMTTVKIMAGCGILLSAAALTWSIIG